MQAPQGGWWRAMDLSSRSSGWFPASHVRLLPQTQSQPQDHQPQQQQQQLQQHQPAKHNPTTTQPQPPAHHPPTAQTTNAPQKPPHRNQQAATTSTAATSKTSKLPVTTPSSSSAAANTHGPSSLADVKLRSTATTAQAAAAPPPASAANAGIVGPGGLFLTPAPAPSSNSHRLRSESAPAPATAAAAAAEQASNLLAVPATAASNGTRLSAIANAVVSFNFDARNEDELNLQVGQLVHILRQPEGGWWYGRVIQDAEELEGWFPANHVRIPTSPQSQGQKSLARVQDAATAKSAVAPLAQPQLSDMMVSKPAGQPTTTLPANVIASAATDSKALPVQITTTPAAALAERFRAPMQKELSSSSLTGAAKGDAVRGRRVSVSSAQSSVAASRRPLQRQGTVPAMGEGHDQEGSEGGGRTSSTSISTLARAASLSLEPPARRPSVTRMMLGERSRINAEINKELRIRAGAENMLKALNQSGKKKEKKEIKDQREEVQVTLCFTNARLQQLRRQLQAINGKTQAFARQSMLLREANTPVEAQHIASAMQNQAVSLVALGLKEAGHVDLRTPLAAFIERHYKRDAQEFEAQLAALQTMRDVITMQSLDDDVRQLHFAYYHQLVYTEHRFFPDGYNVDIVFHWYDSLNGIPTQQRSLALEKACVLFNAGALYTQMAAGRDLSKLEELDAARDDFEAAAGTFQYILDNFDNAPSADISATFLTMLVGLCLAQAQECLVLIALHNARSQDKLLAPGELATVAELYKAASGQMEATALRDYVAPAWKHVVGAKALLYEAMADYFTAVEQLADVRGDSRNAKSATFTGVARLCRAEDILRRLEKKCQDLLAHDQGLNETVSGELRRVHEALKPYDVNVIFDHIDSRQQLIKDMMATKAEAELVCHPTYPELHLGANDAAGGGDLFDGLGPISVFNAYAIFHPLRQVQLSRDEGLGYGFTLAGNSPVRIHGTSPGGPAAKAELMPGDAICAINGDDVRSCRHDVVVLAMKTVRNSCKLTVQYIENASRGQGRESTADSLLTASVDAPLPDLDFSQLHRADLTGKSLKGGKKQQRTAMSEFAGVRNAFGEEVTAFNNPLWFTAMSGPGPQLARRGSKGSAMAGDGSKALARSGSSGRR